MASMLVNCLIVWRVTRLLFMEDGPYQIIGKFRDLAGVSYTQNSQPFGTTEIGKALACKFCLSVWVGLAVALVTGRPVIEGFGYSAGALLFDELYQAVKRYKPAK